ncbi:hypothetical protein J6590_016885 [Homalodisca vitripennis]|nr:hypothetical protein J6590_016885 [Homalodisca vitripennis]
MGTNHRMKSLCNLEGSNVINRSTRQLLVFKGTRFVGHLSISEAVRTMKRYRAPGHLVTRYHGREACYHTQGHIKAEICVVSVTYTDTVSSCTVVPSAL